MHPEGAAVYPVLLVIRCLSFVCFLVLEASCALQLKQQAKDDTKQGALMHVTVEGAQARLMVLPANEATTQSALEFITRVDPPSQGVPMRQVRPWPITCQQCMICSYSLPGAINCVLLLKFARHACSKRRCRSANDYCSLCCNGFYKRMLWCLCRSRSCMWMWLYKE